MAGQIDEGRLDDFLGQVRGADLAKGSGVDEIQVSADDLGEGVFSVLAGIAGEQFQIGFIHV